ncbi:TolC family protein [Gemmata sp. JC717]|uniref:TolC family protein n=1 Tax=Gemmata algarum TaxID=2975278 RepID=UPI0021BB4D04|nr:TolC family protein [Gemmata algarum]MDY3552506.1 TolC family protein [Gemmata algarum]
MPRVLTSSALLALVLAANVGGQQPKADPPKKEDKSAAGVNATAIATALANDPDVRTAQAKIQLAEAELAKARFAVVQKVTALATTIEQQKALFEAVQMRFTQIERAAKFGGSGGAELIDARIELARTRIALAAAEAEWKLLTEPENGALGNTVRPYGWSVGQWAKLSYLPPTHQEPAPNVGAYRWYGSGASPAPITGPIPDRLRAVLDKPIKLGAKGETIRIDQALELLKKEVGFDVPVRGELLQPHPKVSERGEVLYEDAQKRIPITTVPRVVSEGETLPVGALLQLYQDVSGGTFYVREYGLLLADKKSAPPDAPTLTEFWKQGAPKPEPKPKSDPAPEPKPK